MRLPDTKFAKNKARYIFQCLLATVSVLVVLIILDAIHNAAVIASLGASAFIVFAFPRTRSSRARIVIGGYVVGAVVGAGCHLLGRLDLAAHPVLQRYLLIASAALAVGLAVLLMTVTNTEHPPAAGIALGLVLGECSVRTVSVVLVGIVVLCMLRWVLRRWLIDLM